MLILCDTLNILYMYIGYTKTEGNIIKNNNFKCLFIVYLLYFFKYIIDIFFIIQKCLSGKTLWGEMKELKKIVILV